MYQERNQSPVLSKARCPQIVLLFFGLGHLVRGSGYDTASQLYSSAGNIPPMDS